MVAIGIDLGTTFSAIASLDDLGNPEVLASIEDNRKITASAVYLKDKEVIVGDKAILTFKFSEDINELSIDDFESMLNANKRKFIFSMGSRKKFDYSAQSLTCLLVK